MQIFDLLYEMKGNTISKDVNKTALNFDLFVANHINMSTLEITRWRMICSKPIFIIFIHVSFVRDVFYSKPSISCEQVLCWICMWGKTDKSDLRNWEQLSVSVTIRERTAANKVTKHVVPAFPYILPSQKRFWTLFFSGSESISLFFTCGMSCIGNLSASICYCLWDISVSKYISVDIEDISLFIGFFSSGIFGETWCWRHWQEVARGFSTRLQRLKTIENFNIWGKVFPCKSWMTEVPHNSCIYG